MTKVCHSQLSSDSPLSCPCLCVRAIKLYQASRPITCDWSWSDNLYLALVELSSPPPHQPPSLLSALDCLFFCVLRKRTDQCCELWNDSSAAKGSLSNTADRLSFAPFATTTTDTPHSSPISVYKPCNQPLSVCSLQQLWQLDLSDMILCFSSRTALIVRKWVITSRQNLQDYSYKAQICW